MTNQTVTGTPAKIQQSGYTGQWTLQNTGSNPLYIDNNASVSPISGYIVLPGVSLPMTTGIDIWVVATDTLPTTIATVDGVSGSLAQNIDITGPVTVGGNVNATITNATVPISGAVNATITNATLDVTGSAVTVSGTVNASITNATLNVAGSVGITGVASVNITNASVPITGNVSISGTPNVTINANAPITVNGGTLTSISNTVTVQGIVSTEPSNGGVFLGTYTATVASTAGAGGRSVTIINNANQIDVSKYSSVLMFIGTSGLPTAQAVQLGNSPAYQLGIGFDAGTNFQVIGFGSAGALIAVPAAGLHLNLLTYFQYNSAASSSWTLTIQIYGFYSDVPPSVQFQFQNIFGGGPGYTNSTIPHVPAQQAIPGAGTSIDYVICHDSRGIRYALEGEATAWNGNAILYTPHLSAGGVINGAVDKVAALYTPTYPTSVSNFYTSADVRVSLSQLAVHQVFSTVSVGNIMVQPLEAPSSLIHSM